MGQALYRKYRSRSFDELQGQQHITKTLMQSIERGDINHAYLFTGPRGVGKTSVARILAHAINKLPYSDKPHLDIIEIDAASNRRVEDVRDLREKVHIAPTSAPYKVYIIDEVHMLTSESFNALLKTLEEPPAHVVFILATTELQKLPATITSRTQRFAFRAPTPALIVNHLASLAAKEDIALEPDALALIAEHSDGSFRDSVSLLDQVRGLAEPSQTITESAVAQLLGLPAATSVRQLAEAALRGDNQAVVTELRQAEAAGVAATTLASQLIRHLITQAATTGAALPILDKLIEVPRSSHPAARLLLALLPTYVARPTPALAPPVAPTSTPLKRGSAHTSSPAKTTPPKASKSPVETTPKQATDIKTTPAAATASTEFDFSVIANQWGTILEAVKQHSPALFGILRTVLIADGPANDLLVTCKYSIHKKQLESARHQTALRQALLEVTGMGQFAITINVDTEVIATKPIAAIVPTTTEASAIVELMGGGEMVQYSA